MRPIGAAAALLALVACFLAIPSAAEASRWRWPVEGHVITPYSNGSDPYAGGQHRGIDVAAPVGAPVVAATAGIVTFAGSVGSSGLTVAIRTDDGFDTSYLHLSSISVGEGERVAPGAPVGQVGTTGRRSAAEPHLHFGVRAAGSRFAYRDPLDFLPVVPPPAAPPEPVAVPEAVPVRPRANPLPAVALVLPALLAPHSLHLIPPQALPAQALPALPRHELAYSLPGHRSGAARSPAPVRLHTATLAPKPGLVRTTSPHGRTPVGHSHAATAPHPAIGPRGASAIQAARLAPRPPARNARRRPAGGLDLGWLAACLAMVAAATILGRPRASTRSLRRAFDLPLASAHSEPDRP